MARIKLTLVLLVLTAVPALAQERKFDQAAYSFFETNVRPVLVNRCYRCHGPEMQKSKLRVDSLAGLLQGGKAGPSLQPGRPDESLLIQAIRHSDNLQMPPRMKLPAKEIADVTAWVKMGAPWPNAKAAIVKVDDKVGAPVYTREQAGHWAFQPVRKAKIPAVKNQAWPRSPLDAFILASLEEKGLAPARPADARTLIRRLYFDLIGLPPTPQEVEDFVRARQGPEEQQRQALGQVVDRLLASPRYGERWARHWLDVVRYADSNGMDENLVFGNAWRYRDYVIRAFNSDKPYNQFVREQIAGDLLVGSNTDNDRLIATGFLCIGPKMLAEDDPVKMEMDIIDEQLDTMGRAFLGLTIGCARCHDHKFDPFSAADYYGLAGILKSTRTMNNFRVVASWQELPLNLPLDQEALKLHAQKVADFKGKVKQAVQRHYQDLVKPARQRAQDYLRTAVSLKNQGKQAGTLEQLARETGLNREFLRQWLEHLQKQAAPADAAALDKLSSDANGPFRYTASVEAAFTAAAKKELTALRAQLAKLEKAPPRPPETMAVGERKATELRIHLRGNHMTLGREAPRRFPSFFSGLRQPAIAAGQSGRLQLADWLTQPEHPLTSRVMVNRLWHGHFGTGLVRSVDNFGLLGDRPSHPELLDWLAAEFAGSGWSIKAMHRLIVMSATYQMSSTYNADAFQIDPDNRLHWRHSRRRLEAEALRDSLYVLGGKLELTMGGSLFEAKNRAYVPGYPNGSYSKFDIPRRSIYLPVIRSAQYEVLQAFDFADPSFPSGERATTTVAPQALFLMNGKIVHEQTRAWMDHVLAEKELDDSGRVRRIYMQAFGRPPTDKETGRCLEFVARIEGEMVRMKMTDGRVRAWQSLARVIVAANEFVYVE